MCRLRTIELAAVAGLVLAWRGALAQTQPVAGLYQIVSGRYVECCGIVGTEVGQDLPSPEQAYVHLQVDSQSGLASMKLLSADLQTVFRVVPCPTVGSVNFSFDHGFSAGGVIQFHVDPGPPPYGLYWNYSVSNAPGRLQINGTLGTAQSPCVDTPTRFGHSNLVAVLIGGPALRLLELSKDNGARLMVQGHAGHTNVIEASSDLVTWAPVSTNIMDFSTCPTCPFVIFQDAAGTNRAIRFYRAFEIW